MSARPIRMGVPSPIPSHRRKPGGAKLVSDKAYAPFMLAFAPANLAVKGVHGPGLTTKIPPVLVNTGVQWESVWMSHG